MNKLFEKFKKHFVLIALLAVFAGFCITLAGALTFGAPLQVRDLVGILAIGTPFFALAILGVTAAIIVPSNRSAGRYQHRSPENPLKDFANQQNNQQLGGNTTFTPGHCLKHRWDE